MIHDTSNIGTHGLMRKRRLPGALMILAALCILAPASPARASSPPYCLAENHDRYAAYASEHPDKAYEDILIEVNLHLDERNYKNVAITDQPESLTVLVTKHYGLSRDYKPENLVEVDARYGQRGVKLREDCYTAFLSMAGDMEAEGLTPYMKSGYRTNRKRGGENSLWYAWPGHSEHQTGLAFDLRKKNVTYETLGAYKYHKTDEYAWLCENAHLYGFILSFPKGYSDITGFGFEPWHWRYIGADTATHMKELGIQTFHQYWAMYLTDQ